MCGSRGVASYGPDNSARLTAIKTETDARIGEQSAPHKAVGDVGLDPGAVANAALDEAVKGAVGGLAKGVAMTVWTGGVAAEGLPLAVVGGALLGAVKGAAENVYEQVTSTEAKTPRTDEATKDALEPARSQEAYSEFVKAYFGDAPMPPRVPTLSSAGSDPRKSNPGRDRDGAESPMGAPKPLRNDELTVPVNPQRSIRNDARADKLAGTPRVGGRLIITDGNAEADGRPSGIGPRPQGVS